MLRKIIVAGGTKEQKSYSVTIPIKFMRKNKLEQGDILNVKFEIPKYLTKSQLKNLKENIK